MNSRKVAFHHFGCKVNFAEESTLSRQFIEKGYEMTDFREVADVYVISTCVVTAVAEKKCRAAIRQAHKINPNAKIAVIGCYSELKRDEIAKIDGVDVILGHSEKFGLLEAIENGVPEPGHEVKPYSKMDFIPSVSWGDRTRSFLKIQDGCDYYCSYCTIPLARGNSRSDTIDHVLKSASEAASKGITEIVLTGVNIGDFGKHNKETFSGLLTELDKLTGIRRIRISSVEPDLLTDQIIEFVGQSQRIMPHFHLPLQSGSNNVLKAMKRKYSAELFSSRVEKIRSVLPSACIASDVIAGFPGETEDDFNQTYNLIQGLDISYLHVFSYSARENTLASMMTNLVQDSVKKSRSERLHRLSEEKKRKFYLSNIGTESSVLFESDNSDGFMHGFTENYLKVKTPFDASLVNQVRKIRLERLDEEFCFSCDHEDLF